MSHQVVLYLVTLILLAPHLSLEFAFIVAMITLLLGFFWMDKK